MTHGPGRENLDPAEVRALDALVREARDPDGERPSDEAIAAYLEGRATDEQSAEVQEALARSRGFREELVHLGELADPSARRAFDEVRVPKPRAERRPAPIPLPRTRSVRTWGWLGAGALAAAAAIAVSLTGGPTELRDPRWLPGPRVVAEQFEASPLRGSPGSETVPATPDEAAVLAFLKVVSFDGSAFTTHPAEDAPDPGWGRRMEIGFRDGQGEERARYVTAVPEEATDVALVLLDLPSLQTRRLPLLDDAVRVPLPDPRSTTVAALTFVHEGRPGSTSATTVTPRNGLKGAPGDR